MTSRQTFCAGEQACWGLKPACHFSARICILSAAVGLILRLQVLVVCALLIFWIQAELCTHCTSPTADCRGQALIIEFHVQPLQDPICGTAASGLCMRSTVTLQQCLDL